MTTMLTLAMACQFAGAGQCNPASALVLAQAFPAQQLPGSFTPTQPAPPPLGPAKAQLIDANGQAWDHADGKYLEAWIAGRNSALIERRNLPPKAEKPASMGEKPKPSEPSRVAPKPTPKADAPKVDILPAVSPDHASTPINRRRYRDAG